MGMYGGKGWGPATWQPAEFCRHQAPFNLCLCEWVLSEYEGTVQSKEWWWHPYYTGMGNMPGKGKVAGQKNINAHATCVLVV